MVDSNAQPAPFPFMDLPTELRLAVYKAAFAHLAGEVKVGPSDNDSTSLPRVDSGLSLVGLEGRVHHLRFHHDATSGPSQPPPNLLLTNRAIYNEAKETFLKTRTFRFADVRAMHDFASKNEWAHASCITSIILAYSHCSKASEVSGMLHAASRHFPHLQRLSIDVGFTLSETEQQALQDALVHAFEQHGIKAAGIFVLDFALEKAFDEVMCTPGFDSSSEPHGSAVPVPRT